MLKRYSIPEIMPEKTLKDKVIDARTTLASERADMEEARQAGVYQRADDYETDIHNINVIEEALTALEERVKELEKKQRTHEISAVYCPNSQELELTWEDCQSGKKEHLLVVVPGDKGEAIADIVPLWVSSPAVIKEARDAEE